MWQGKKGDFAGDIGLNMSEILTRNLKAGFITAFSRSQEKNEYAESRRLAFNDSVQSNPKKLSKRNIEVQE